MQCSVECRVIVLVLVLVLVLVVHTQRKTPTQPTDTTKNKHTTKQTPTQPRGTTRWAGLSRQRRVEPNISNTITSSSTININSTSSISSISNSNSITTFRFNRSSDPGGAAVPLSPASGVAICAATGFRRCKTALDHRRGGDLSRQRRVGHKRVRIGNIISNTSSSSSISSINISSSSSSSISSNSSALHGTVQRLQPSQDGTQVHRCNNAQFSRTVHYLT